MYTQADRVYMEGEPNLKGGGGEGGEGGGQSDTERERVSGERKELHKDLSLT